MKFAGKHPKDTPEGAILWPRHQPYVVGDRMRGTVLIITETSIMEMVPAYAKAFADEMLTHASDVGDPLVGASDNGGDHGSRT